MQPVVSVRQGKSLQKEINDLWPKCVAKITAMLPPGYTDPSWGYNPNDGLIYLYSHLGKGLKELCTDFGPVEFIQWLKQ